MNSQVTVLIAHGSESSLALAKAFLESRGILVQPAADGPTAFVRAIAEPPALVVLHDSLKGIEGTAICQRLKADMRTRHLPIVGVSLSDAQEAWEGWRAAGADAIVAESHGLEVLLQAIGQLLQIPVRRYVRIPVVFKVQRPGAKESLGRAAELSEGGMRLEVGRQYERNSELEVRFMLPGRPPAIETQARVCWVKPGSAETYWIGLEFSALPPEHREQLKRYIESRLSAS